MPILEELFRHYSWIITVRKLTLFALATELHRSFFLEKFGGNFQRVTEKSLLGATKPGNGGFGSTGLGVIKQIKVDEEEKFEEEVNHHKCDDKCLCCKLLKSQKRIYK